MKQSLVCPHCGAIAQEGYTFCHTCGFPLHGENKLSQRLKEEKSGHPLLRKTAESAVDHVRFEDLRLEDATRAENAETLDARMQDEELPHSAALESAIKAALLRNEPQQDGKIIAFPNALEETTDTSDDKLVETSAGNEGAQEETQADEPSAADAASAEAAMPDTAVAAAEPDEVPADRESEESELTASYAEAPHQVLYVDAEETDVLDAVAAAEENGVAEAESAELEKTSAEALLASENVSVEPLSPAVPADAAASDDMAAEQPKKKGFWHRPSKDTEKDPLLAFYVPRKGERSLGRKIAVAVVACLLIGGGIVAAAYLLLFAPRDQGRRLIVRPDERVFRLSSGAASKAELPEEEITVTAAQNSSRESAVSTLGRKRTEEVAAAAGQRQVELTDKETSTAEENTPLTPSDPVETTAEAESQTAQNKAQNKSHNKENKEDLSKAEKVAAPEQSSSVSRKEAARRHSLRASSGQYNSGTLPEDRREAASKTEQKPLATAGSVNAESPKPATARAENTAPSEEPTAAPTEAPPEPTAAAAEVTTAPLETDAAMADVTEAQRQEAEAAVQAFINNSDLDREAIKAQAIDLIFDDAKNDTDTYLNKIVIAGGEISQVLGKDFVIYDDYYVGGYTYYQHPWYIIGEHLPDEGLDENDIINFYGVLVGFEKVNTVDGFQEKIPIVYALFGELYRKA